MKALSSLFKSHTGHLFVLLALFAASELFLFPVDDFPLNDDWSYAHSVRYFHETGIMDIGYWPAMNLVAHILWGNIAVSCFGFSHAILRGSTLVLAVLSLLLLYRLLFSVSKNKTVALLLSLLLLFNPWWFLLSNTFMTDVPFLFALLLAFHCLEKVLVQNKAGYIIGFCLACIYAILIRQFGLALALSLFTLLFVLMLREARRLRLLLLTALPLALSLATYFCFGHWVSKHLPPGSAYQAAGMVTSGSGALLEEVGRHLLPRFSENLLYIGLFLCPLCLIVAVQSLRALSWKRGVAVLLASGLLLVPALSDIHHFPIGNILYNTGLGVESLYDTTILNTNHAHAWSGHFSWIVTGLGVAGLYALLIAAVASGLRLLKQVRKEEPLNRNNLYLFVFFMIYGLLLCVSKSYFDRYGLPLLLCVLLLLGSAFHTGRVAVLLIGLYIAVTACFTVPATHDYFSWNRARWELVREHVQKGGDAGQINGGFEYVASTFYDGSWWGLWVGEEAPYKLGFGPIPGHERVTYKTFRRYIPYGMDTVFVYRKQVPDRQ